MPWTCPLPEPPTVISVANASAITIVTSGTTIARTMLFPTAFMKMGSSSNLVKFPRPMTLNSAVYPVQSVSE